MWSPGGAIYNNLATTSPEHSDIPAIDKISTTLATISTTTMLTTVFVPSSTPTNPLQAPDSVTTNDTSTEVIQPITHDTPHATILLGLGVGLVIGVLLLAGIAGLYFWRRRKNILSNSDINNTSEVNMPGYCNPFIRLLKPQDDTKSQEDAEWSIESAEKVSIVRNMRAHSVLTRSSSKRSNASDESAKVSVGILEQDMRVALTSHPMTPSYVAFASRNAVVIGTNTKAMNELELKSRSIQQ